MPHEVKPSRHDLVWPHAMVQSKKYSFGFTLLPPPSGWLETVSEKKSSCLGKSETLASSGCWQIARLFVALHGKAGQIPFPAAWHSPPVVHVVQFESNRAGRTCIRDGSSFLSSRTTLASLWSKKDAQQVLKFPDLAGHCTGSKCSPLKWLFLCLRGPNQIAAVVASLAKANLLEHWF